jgi:hypothetical protein
VSSTTRAGSALRPFPSHACQQGNLKRFKVERVRQGIPVLIGLIILTIVRVMVNH